MARGLAGDADEIEYYNALPQTLTLDAAGDFMPGETVREHAQLWSIACEYWDAVREATIEPAAGGDDGENVTFPLSWQWQQQAAAVALSANYRLARTEVAMLRLFDTRLADSILNCIIDGPTIEQWYKKKQNLAASAGSSTDDGPPD